MVEGVNIESEPGSDRTRSTRPIAPRAFLFKKQSVPSRLSTVGDFTLNRGETLGPPQKSSGVRLRQVDHRRQMLVNLDGRRGRSGSRRGHQQYVVARPEGRPPHSQMVFPRTRNTSCSPRRTLGDIIGTVRDPPPSGPDGDRRNEFRLLDVVGLNPEYHR